MSESLIAVIRDDFAAADLGRITFQPRRDGAEESRYRRYAVELARSFDYLNSRDPRNLSAYADKALGLGSWLFVVGTAAREWKRWLALAAFGAFALNRFTLARSLAILADEWDFVDHLDGRSVPGPSIEDRVVASLTEEGAPKPPPHPAPAQYSRACLSL